MGISLPQIYKLLRSTPAYAEQNYEIHAKELLAIIVVLIGRPWAYLVGLDVW